MANGGRGGAEDVGVGGGSFYSSEMQQRSLCSKPINTPHLRLQVISLNFSVNIQYLRDYVLHQPVIDIHPGACIYSPYMGQVLKPSPPRGIFGDNDF